MKPDKTLTREAASVKTSADEVAREVEELLRKRGRTGLVVVVGPATTTNADADPIVDVAKEVPLPRALVYRAARAGEIAGAAKKGRRWLAARSAVRAWLTADRDDKPKNATDLRESLGLRRSA